MDTHFYFGIALVIAAFSVCGIFRKKKDEQDEP